MDIHTNIEKHWRRFPSLHALIFNKSIPPQSYHHGGLRSPYTTVFDDLHDIAEISTIVAANRDRIAAAAESQGHANDPADDVSLNDLMHDLDQLRGATRAFAALFLQRAEDIERVLRDVDACSERRRKMRPNDTRGEQ